MAALLAIVTSVNCLSMTFSIIHRAPDKLTDSPFKIIILSSMAGARYVYDLLNANFTTMTSQSPCVHFDTTIRRQQ